MRIVPVLDLMHGEVVRGVGGRRHEYRPIVSRLSASSRPLDVADALASHYGLSELYVADLDAIGGGEPAWPVYAALHQRGFRLWVDAGIATRTRACQLAVAGIDSIVAGLETLAGPAELEAMAQTFEKCLVFSLDLHQGQPLGDSAVWHRRDAKEIAALAVHLGVCRLLVLDLARVGGDGGPYTLGLCAHLGANYPQLSVSTGGGVRHRGDLEALRNCGVREALVASALHDGRVTRTDLEDMQERIERG
jgi:phosphoribosylformimino-5-aminoimidazole carboxamide ribotide isomerase